MAKKASLVIVAILCAFELDAQRYTPGQLVEFNADTAKGLADQGQIDTNAYAVAHLKKEGAQVIRHPAPETAPEPEQSAENPAPDESENTDAAA